MKKILALLIVSAIVLFARPAVAQEGEELLKKRLMETASMQEGPCPFGDDTPVGPRN